MTQAHPHTPLGMTGAGDCNHNPSTSQNGGRFTFSSREKAGMRASVPHTNSSPLRNLEPSPLAIQDPLHGSRGSARRRSC
jgi:hypothetical protein